MKLKPLLKFFVSFDVNLGTIYFTLSSLVLWIGSQILRFRYNDISLYTRTVQMSIMLCIWHSVLRYFFYNSIVFWINKLISYVFHLCTPSVFSLQKLLNVTESGYKYYQIARVQHIKPRHPRSGWREMKKHLMYFIYNLEHFNKILTITCFYIVYLFYLKFIYWRF